MTAKKPTAKIPAWMKTWKMLDKTSKGVDNFFLCIGMTEDQEEDLTNLMNVLHDKAENWSDEVQMGMALDVSEDTKRMIMFKLGVGVAIMKAKMNPFDDLLKMLGK